MDKILDIVVEKLNNNTIEFAEPFYMSNDKKTVMGEVPFSEILFLEYRDTEAGSNPREYIGLKKTNESIIKSLLKDCENMFRFLHSGIIVSLVNPIIHLERKLIEYDDCCLTNGNQTRFIILIIVVLKLIFHEEELTVLKQRQINSFIKDNFPDSPKTRSIMPYIRYNKINQIINFLIKNNKYLKSFKKLKLEYFLKSRIRIQLNLINSIVDDLEDELDTYSAGTLIAEANNDTQKVRADDIFGNKYKEELEKNIFKDFIIEYQKNVKIEYRLGEVVEKIDKVHILTLLRPVVATGILTKEKDIFNFTNQRDPIYKLFERLLNKNKGNKIVSIISKLIPFLYNIRENYVKPILEKHRRNLIRKYKEKALMGDLESSIIGKDITKVKDDDLKLEKIIKNAINYNIEHILPVLIFRIKHIIDEVPENRNIKLNMDEGKISIFLQTLIEIIYEKYVEKKLEGLPTSLTTVVRSRDFYDIGSESYKTLIRTFNLSESDFIYKYRILI
jgi:IMP cyclohydrolase